jgi:hypothetical protein
VVISFLDVNIGGKASHAHPMLFFDCLENKKNQNKTKIAKNIELPLGGLLPKCKMKCIK